MSSDPKLFVVSAPSGTGKSSLIKDVITRSKAADIPCEFSVSHTTRTPREIKKVKIIFLLLRGI